MSLSYYPCEVELTCDCGALRLVPGVFDNGGIFLLDDDTDLVCPVCFLFEDAERVPATERRFYRGLYQARCGLLVHNAVAMAWDHADELARLLPDG